MSELKSRKQLEGDKGTRKTEADQQVKVQEVTVKDKSVAGKTAGELRQEGTQEGARKVKDAMQRAGKEIDSVMEKQKQESDKKAAGSRKAEQSIDKSAKASEGDAQRARRGAAEVKAEGGRRAIEEAVKAASEDKDYLKKLEAQEREIRKFLEDRTKSQAGKVKSTQVKTRR